jgi:mRNA-degrading endonuclease toxin of MazEF toxin-antitoxin module
MEIVKLGGHLCLSLGGRRPVLLLSRNEAYSYLNKFAAVEVTSTVRRMAVEVPLGRSEGLRAKCVANRVHRRPNESVGNRRGVSPR